MIIPVTLETFQNTDLTELGKGFFSECKLPGEFDLAVFRHNWSLMLAGNFGAMWFLQKDGVTVGALGALLFPDINDGKLIATETFWYVLPKHRLGIEAMKLLFSFEKWAMDRKAVRVIMVHLKNQLSERLHGFYIARGYEETEVTYVKRL
jgi:hypothetical protein